MVELQARHRMQFEKLRLEYPARICMSHLKQHQQIHENCEDSV